MPTRRINRGLGKAAIAVAAISLAAAPAAPAAGRDTSTTDTSQSQCSFPATSQVFSGFGDPSWYYLASGGAMESLTWSSTGGASIVAGNEPWYLAGSRHKNSLRLPKGASTRSARFCISADTPHLRFLAKSQTGSGQLDVRVDTYAANGQITNSSSGGIAPDVNRGWAPTPFISLNTAGMFAGQHTYATLTVYSQGDWLIDDVFIDPYRRG